MKEISYFSKLGEIKATLIIWAFDGCIISILVVVRIWIILVFKRGNNMNGVRKILGKHYENIRKAFQECTHRDTGLDQERLNENSIFLCEKALPKKIFGYFLGIS